MAENIAQTELQDLTEVFPPLALSGVDGRYRVQCEPLINALSEAALNRQRVAVEIEWLIFVLEAELLPLSKPWKLNSTAKTYLRNIVRNFGADDIAQLAKIEAQTRHDVKAVEYYLQAKIQEAPNVSAEIVALPKIQPLLHLLCTSEDINNLAYALCIKTAVNDIWLPAATALVEEVEVFAQQTANIPMLARTHGQTATPTTVGKELAVFAHRWRRVIKQIAGQEYVGKFNGATGTFSAHTIALPQVDWLKMANQFINSLGLTANPLTTQIEQHDWQTEIYAQMARFGIVAHNFATDLWTYISNGYFRQKLGHQGSTGSSTMPHKVNPIRFENAEANLEVAQAWWEVITRTLSTSRLQRDLTDSSMQRNIGLAFAHSYLAISNLRAGIAGLEVDQNRLNADLENAWEVLGEAIQQVMRVQAATQAIDELTAQAADPISVIEETESINKSFDNRLENPYEQLKELTRGKDITPAQLRNFITELGLSTTQTEVLNSLTPAGYIGLANELVTQIGNFYPANTKLDWEEKGLA